VNRASGGRGMNGSGSARMRVLRRLWSQIAIVGPALILVIAGFVVAFQFVEPAPPDRIVMATGPQAGAYHAFGRQYAARFRREGVELELRATAGSRENLRLLEDESSGVTIAFMQGGIGQPENHPDLVSLGSVYFEPLWVFVRGDDQLRRLTSLVGARIAVGGAGSGTRELALFLLAQNGIDERNARLVEIGGDEAARALQDGEVDAAMFVTSVSSETVRGLLDAPGIALMSFEQADAYTRRYRFLSKVLLPMGTVDLARNLPPAPTVLLAPAATLVASPRMHPALIDLALLTMREAHRAGGHLESPGEFPSARYITYPLEPAAQRFYERGPPLLQRYLPFWAANLMDRLKIMILPLVTLLYPLFKILPPAYSWRMRTKVNRWYKQLQAVDDRLRDHAIAREEANEILDRIENAVERVSLPAGFAANAYTLRLHIDFLRHKAAKAPAGGDDAASAA